MAFKKKRNSAILLFVRCVFSFNLYYTLAFCKISHGRMDIELRPVLFYDGKTLAEVIFDEFGVMKHCRLHELEEESDADPIIKASGLSVKYPSFKEMLHLINSCTQLEIPRNNTYDATSSTNSSLHDISSWTQWALWNGIAPGTKWCGVGDIAGSFEDLGTEVNVDACCRAHDHCPVKLKAFRAGYGLLNLSLYTKSHCDCDRDFFSCLKNTGNKFADIVGNFYFNFMKLQCIKESRPLICVANRTDVDGAVQCVQWSEDLNSTKMRATLSQLEY